MFISLFLCISWEITWLFFQLFHRNLFQDPFQILNLQFLLILIFDLLICIRYWTKRRNIWSVKNIPYFTEIEYKVGLQFILCSSLSFDSLFLNNILFNDFFYIAQYLFLLQSLYAIALFWVKFALLLVGENIVCGRIL